MQLAPVLHVHDPYKRFMPTPLRGDWIGRVLNEKYGDDPKIKPVALPIEEGKSINEMLLEAYLK